MLGTSNYMNYSRRNPKTQCKVWLPHWNIGIVYCTCGHFFHKKKGRTRNSSIIRWPFSPWVCHQRRENFMDIDMIKSRETKNTIRLISQRKNARKCISKESKIDSYEIQNSVIEWLKIIEKKKFVDDGMLLRMKITLTIWLNKNTFFYNNWWLRSNKQGSNIVSVTYRPDFKQALSILQQLKQYSHRNQKIVQSSSSWWNWQGLWWTPYSYESHDGDEPSTDRMWWPVDKYLEQFIWTKLSWKKYFVTDGSFAGDSSPL